MTKKILKNNDCDIEVVPQTFYLVFFALGIFILVVYYSTNKAYSASIGVIEPIYAADFSNDNILVGASHNVFVGKVLEQSGTKERGIGPETQFNVQVIENIKGELKDVVMVNQQGGYKDGVLYVIEGNNDTLTTSKNNSYLLRPGSTYLLATRYNSEENWYTLNPYPTASKILNTNENNLDDSQLKTLAESDSRVQELKTAYPNEILIDADVKNGNSLNSYQSVQEKSIAPLLPNTGRPSEGSSFLTMAGILVLVITLLVIARRNHYM